MKFIDNKDGKPVLVFKDDDGTLQTRQPVEKMRFKLADPFDNPIPCGAWITTESKRKGTVVYNALDGFGCVDGHVEVDPDNLPNYEWRLTEAFIFNRKGLPQ